MMKSLISLLLILSTTAYSASYEQSFLGVPPQAYTDFATFPTVAPAGTLAVDKTTNDLYVYDLDALAWVLITGGGGGGVSSVSGSAPIASSGGATPTISISQANGSTNGYLSSSDWTTFNGKEGAITAGTSAQYWRGDKTFQTLDSSVVPENTNLYWTNTRFDTRFGLKTTTDLAEGTNLYYTDTRFDNRLSAKFTTDLAEGTNLYFTDTRARTAAVADEINNGTTNIAPSQNAVFDALALKADAATSWNTGGNAVAGGKIGTTGSENFDIVAGNVPVLTFIDSHKGALANINILPVDATSINQFEWNLLVNPTSSTNGASHVSQYNRLIWDNVNAGFGNSNGNLRSSENTFTHNGSGTINYGAINVNSASFNNSGTTQQFKGVTSENSVSSGATVSNYAGLVSGLSTTGGILPDSTGVNQYATYTNATIGSVNGLNGSLTFDGTTASSAGVNGFNSFTRFDDTASTVNSVYGYSSGIDLNDDADVNGLYGFNSNFNLRNNSESGFLNGLNLNLTQQDAAISTGANAINVNYTYGGTGTAGDVNLLNLYGRTLDTVDLNSFSAVNVNPELEGTSVVDNATIANFGGQFRQNATFQNITGMGLSPQLSGSASAVNFFGLSLTPQITGTATLTNAFTAMNVNPTISNAAGVSGATGISIDMQNVDLSSAAIAAGAQKIGLNVSDGAISANLDYTPPAAATFFQNHYMGGAVTVDSGTPISAFGFGTNLAQTLNANDDWTIDPSGLGFVNVGFVGAVNVAATKTVAKWTGALGGAGNPSGTGTITDAIMFRGAGILPQGGSISVTNMYGFQVDPNLFCLIGTNCWGFFEDTTNAENHLSKLAIDTATNKVANSSTALEIGAAKGFINGRVTTTQRNALTAVDGMQVYDTDLDAMYVYANGSWAEIGASAGGDVDGPASSVDGEVALFDSTTGKLLKRATGSGVAKLTSGVLSVSNVDLTSEVTGTLPNANTTATDANTASAIVARDASGNFTAGTITAALSGNASTATALAANPSDCGAGTKATAIDASGNLTCSAVSLTADVSGTLPVANGGVGTEAQEVPSGTINNSNAAFTLANAPVSNASVKLYKNGTFLRQGTDYTISGSAITMTVAPNFAETLDAVYRY
jgi:hypothetical protein